ncbi:MAG: aspartate kinase, partial [Owenweeksia sp.]
MKVFKFGGASIKDADSVRNVANVLNHFPGEEILIVVSAMGKTTNALEKVVQLFFNRKDGIMELLEEVRENHLAIIRELFPADEHRVHNDVEILFSQLEIICQGKPDENFNKAYDQIVSYGELISTKIVSSYLNSSGYQNKWLDARRLIRTDQNYRFARVDWSFTERLVKDTILAGNRYVVQGFIGSDDDLNPTTLGREGSDYTASVLGYVLGAEEVVIWKDVPGVLNGDPKVFDNTELLNEISYREAIELAYYGASVIHPKTIQPLQKKAIPLRVKSFVNPDATGTLIREGSDLDPVLPCFIKKDNQVLITISTRDLAFIVEEHLSKIYKVFHQYGIRVNLSQNTAVSSSFCINNDPI